MLEELSTAYLYQSNYPSPHSHLVPANDRRGCVRENVNQLCFLIINIKGRKVTARVHDISADGAKIETSCFDLPRHFILDNSINNQRVICKKIWSRDGLTGVEFIRKKLN